MKATLYRLDADGYENQVIHLYEHMVMRRITEIAREHGCELHVLGWLCGVSYDRRVFIDTGIILPEIAQLIRGFMLGAGSRINLADIDVEIVSIECEKRSLFEVADRQKLEAALFELDALQWMDVDEDMSPATIDLRAEYKTVAPDILKFHRSAKSFREVFVASGVRDVTPDEAALFTRLSPLIIDGLTRAIEEYGIYVQDVSRARLSADGKITSNAAHVTVKRGSMNNHQIKRVLQKSFADMISKESNRAMQIYFDDYINQPVWSNIPETIYDTTNLIVSRQYIRSLATEQNIADLLGRIEIDVRPYSGQEL